MTETERASPYRFLRSLAQGGMGRVDLVLKRDGAFARVYVQKRLLSHHANDGEIRAMFLEEARIAGLVRHANVVSVIDVGEDAEGPFLVMDFVDGIPLTKVLARASSAEELLPVQVAVDVAKQMAEGLRAAHELAGAGGKPVRAVHRDVTPSNVIVGFDGVVRVTDFGIARALDRSSHTQTGLVKGKPGYLAPEQLRFEPIDERTDLYALGVVLFEMLSGRRLYVGDPSEVARRIREEPPPDIGEARDDVPPELVALSFELMAKDPNERPPDARAVSRRLGAILAELRAVESPIELSEYLEEHHAEERDAQRREIELALEDRDPTAYTPEPAAAKVASPAPTRADRPVAVPYRDVQDAQTAILDPRVRGIEAETTTRDLPRSTWRVPVAWGALVVLVIAVASSVYLFASADGDEGNAGASPRGAPAESASAPPEASRADELGVARSASPEPSTDEGSSEEGARPDEAEDRDAPVDDAERTTSRGATRSMRRAGSMHAQKVGTYERDDSAPTWSWE